MAKDPAFLFYPSDWDGGTKLFTRQHKGAYIDLLMAQFNNGPLSLEDVKFILNSDFDLMWEQKLKVKFIIDDQGRFFNKKLADEQERRKNFTQSRRDNLTHKAHHMAPHMETATVTGNKDTALKAVVLNKVVMFEEAWLKYPSKDGRKAAQRSFNASINTMADFDRLMAAMGNYLKSEKVLKGFVKNGSTFFANWADWEDFKPTEKAPSNPPAEFVATQCRAMKMDKATTKIELIKKGYSEHRADEAIMTAWEDRH